jgi:hypothetical protein
VSKQQFSQVLDCGPALGWNRHFDPFSEGAPEISQHRGPTGIPLAIDEVALIPFGPRCRNKKNPTKR